MGLGGSVSSCQVLIMKLLTLCIIFSVFVTWTKCDPLYFEPQATLPPPFTAECVDNAYPPQNAPPVPTYKVNLDLPPEQRWQEPLKELAPQIRNLVGQLKEFILEWGQKSQFIIDFID